MNILVIGCGKLGSRIADNLYKQGHSVSVIDQDEESFNKLSDDFDGVTVCGVPMDIEDLKKAGIEKCQAVATVTDDDNLNIIASQIVKEFFGINNVVTRVVDPSREKIFKHFGLKTICETKLSSEAICSSLLEQDSGKQFTFNTSTINFIVRNPESVMVGRNISNIPVRKGEIIIGIIDKNGKIILNGDQEQIVNSYTKIIYAKVID